MTDTAAQLKNSSETDGKLKTTTSPRINSIIKFIFFKNIFRRSNHKIYTYGNINLRTKTITRMTSEYPNI